MPIAANAATETGARASEETAQPTPAPAQQPALAPTQQPTLASTQEPTLASTQDILPLPAGKENELAEPARPKSKPLGVGQLAPEFTLVDQDGLERSLDELLSTCECEQTSLILLFYGLDFAPASTAHLRYFKEKLANFEGTQPRVVGISQSDAEQNARFQDFLELPFDILSDKEQNVAKLYGAPLLHSSSGEGAAAHAVYVLHSKGHITYVDRDFRSSPAADFRALLRALMLQATRSAAENQSGSQPAAGSS